MQSYTFLSSVYDVFMDNIPYDHWAQFIISHLKTSDIHDGLILDLGCGTGIMSELLAAQKYDVIGVDNSEEMLSIALDKKYSSGKDILYLCQDMREFELYGTVKAIICICDSINYILNRQEMVHIFKLVNNYLDPKGLFLFDFTTQKKYEPIAESVIAENREECSFIWENNYDDHTKINQYDLTLFVKAESGKYDKLEETHIQKAYSLEEMKESLEEAGLIFINAFDDFTNQSPNSESQRICVIAQENGK